MPPIRGSAAAGWAEREGSRWVAVRRCYRITAAWEVTGVWRVPVTRRVAATRPPRGRPAGVRRAAGPAVRAAAARARAERAVPAEDRAQPGVHQPGQPAVLRGAVAAADVRRAGHFHPVHLRLRHRGRPAAPRRE